MKSTGYSKNAFCLIIAFIHVAQSQFLQGRFKPNVVLVCQVEALNETMSLFRGM